MRMCALVSLYLATSGAQARSIAMSDDDELLPPPGEAQGRGKVGVKNLEETDEYNGDRRCRSHFELVLAMWFGFLYGGAMEWLTEAAASTTPLQPIAEARRDYGKGVHGVFHGM